jgi:hypothetical protein
VSVVSRVLGGYIPAKVAGFAVGAAGQRDDTVVLRKGRHGRDCHQAGQKTVDAVCKDTALDARFEYLAFNLEI